MGKENSYSLYVCPTDAVKLFCIPLFYRFTAIASPYTQLHFGQNIF